MKIELVGLMALGTLTVALGAVVVFVCFRLSEVRKLITEVERRISRVEILTSLSESKEPRSAKGQAGGTS